MSETAQVRATHASPQQRELPSGWRWVRLGGVCEIVTGGTPPRSEKRYYGGNTPWVKPDDLDRDMFVSASSEYLSEDGASVARLLPKGAVLVSCIGKIGKVAITGCPLATNQQINALVPGSAVDSVFLYFTCQYMRSNWEIATSVALVPILNKSNFASMEIPLPPLDEQQRIAAVLREQMAVVEKARVTAQERFTAVKGLPSAFLRQVFPEPGQPPPDGWRWVKLGEVCNRIDYGYTVSADIDIKEPKFLRITDIQDARVDWDSVPGCAISDADEVANRLEGGDIVFVRTGATTGKSYLISNPPRSVFASYLIRVRTHREYFKPDYLFAFFQSDGYWEQISAGARGGAQPGFNATMLAALKIPLPPLSEQQRIASVLREQMVAVEKARAAAEEEMNTINALPVALLRRAFRGEL
jgi:type I restriction enzyme S subunit